jgi:hypothetical protein
MYGPICRRLTAPLLFAGCLAAAAPAVADTTVAQYLTMEKAGQADLLGGLLQSLAENLQDNNRQREALCLQNLYTPHSEARVVRSQGMHDFLETVEFARESDPEKVTVEEIIAKQLVQYCGTKPSGNPPK